VINAVLCHHPTTALRDGDMVQRAFDALAPIQMYGHEHLFSTTDDSRVLRISAGAVQPERDGAWEPRFNLIQVSQNSSDSLTIRVYPRVWSEEGHVFAPDSDNEQDVVLDLSAAPLEEEFVTPQSVQPRAEVQPEPDVGGRVTSRRQLVFDYSSLPWVRRLLIANELELVSEEDRHLSSVELARRVIGRAEELGRTDELEDAVLKALGRDHVDSAPTKED
jgi:hypothetical protein